jgi:hypothetical protein
VVTRSTHHSRNPLTLLALTLCAATLAALLASVGSGQARERRSGIDAPVTAKEMGVTYGRYLGKRCRYADYTDCNLIGIDVVFSRRATRVVDELGGERIVLRTPGKHNGIPHRDRVGNFTHPDLHHHRSIKGTYLITVTGGLHVRFADGHRATTFLPRVLISSGWG